MWRWRSLSLAAWRATRSDTTPTRRHQRRWPKPPWLHQDQDMYGWAAITAGAPPGTSGCLVVGPCHHTGTTSGLPVGGTRTAGDGRGIRAVGVRRGPGGARRRPVASAHAFDAGGWRCAGRGPDLALTRDHGIGIGRSEASKPQLTCSPHSPRSLVIGAVAFLTRWRRSSCC